MNYNVLGTKISGFNTPVPEVAMQKLATELNNFKLALKTLFNIELEEIVVGYPKTKEQLLEAKIANLEAQIANLNNVISLYRPDL